jgi:hypothetical protein
MRNDHFMLLKIQSIVIICITLLGHLVYPLDTFNDVPFEEGSHRSFVFLYSMFFLLSGPLHFEFKVRSMGQQSVADLRSKMKW